jgi:CheY-like chemotaxis protein
MPEMDGFALAEQIKQTPKLAGATIIMLTSAGQRGDAARCREMGIAVYLIKPVRQSELLEAIQAALGKVHGKEITSVITRHSLRENRRKIQILLAEDNAVNRQLVVRLLEKRGHIVTIALNGAEAVALVKQSRFDVVLMDVQMPEMDGFEATGVIRKEEQVSGRHLPIIAMTAHAMEGDRQRCLAAGMDGYVTKPVKVEELVEIIENLGRFPPVVDTVVASKCPEQHSIDHASALAHVGGDFELLKEITGLFLREIPDLMAALQGAFQSGDAASVQRVAHKLKGSVGNFAAQPAFDAASTLEVLGMEGRLAEAIPVYENLVKEITGLKMAMVELIGPEARP